MVEPEENTVLTVSQLNGQIRDTLQGTFRSVWVAGEISDLSRPGSGHLYYSLKDGDATIKCVTWRSSVTRVRFEPEDGMRVLCCGDVDVYPPRGTYQLIVRQMHAQGEGKLQQALRRLRNQLEAEGLFDRSRKRPLPPYPRRIAVVTSPSGAALRDFLEVVRRRWSDLEILIVPTRVQGIDAGEEISEAIVRASQLEPRPDVLLVTRGGGSLEDLWGFNDESVVRAIGASPIPVVSAVGHEIDVTLSDLAADVRALTPSEAGELLVPDGRELQQRLQVIEARMRSSLRTRFQQAQNRLSELAERRAFRSPFSALQDHERMLDDLHRRSTVAMGYLARQTETRLSHCADRLETLSPIRVLARGYSITQKRDGRIVKSVDEVDREDYLQIRLRDGLLTAEVRSAQAESFAADTVDPAAGEKNP